MNKRDFLINSAIAGVLALGRRSARRSPCPGPCLGSIFNLLPGRAGAQCNDQPGLPVPVLLGEPGVGLAQGRPRGLPIGNLTSQFWSNCYLHPFDEFVKRQLGCRAYLRYVDDFALFSDSKRQLWTWKAAVIERLARLRPSEAKKTRVDGAARRPCRSRGTQ